MIEKRKHHRVHSPQPLVVVDRKTGKELGRLVDLSVGGLLIKTHAIMQVEDVYQLQIMLPQPLGESKQIEITAEVVWVDTLEENATHCAGFLAIEISDYELERIEHLLNQWIQEETPVAL